jgi:hypothetical protein
MITRQHQEKSKTTTKGKYNAESHQVVKITVNADICIYTSTPDLHTSANKIKLCEKVT